MKITNKPAWDVLIYGLIYPGFLGSMLYEFVPTSSADFAWSHFLTLDNVIRVLILLFYFMDYLHLYADMNQLIRDPNKKSLGYFAVDIVTCFGYLAAFIALKIPRYWPTILVFGLIPCLFFLYKRHNIHDRTFLVPYASISLGVFLYRAILCWIFPGLVVMNDQKFALAFVLCHVITYAVYIRWFYERYSRSFDENVLYCDPIPDVESAERR